VAYEALVLPSGGFYVILFSLSALLLVLGLGTAMLWLFTLWE